MTTTNTTAQTSLVANGTAPLPFAFQALSVTEIEVLRNGVVVSPSTYTVVLNGDDTGTVTPTTSWGTDTVLIRSAPNYQNQTHFQRGIPTFPDAFNSPIDRLTRYLLALKRRMEDISGGDDALLRQDLESSGGSGFINFLQSGVGAIIRSVQNKLRDTISVKDFGAVGDGVADDRAAIVAAVTAAAGRTIQFPPGTYKVATAYAAPDGTKFHLQAGASFTTNTPTGASLHYDLGRAAAIAGSKMKLGDLFDDPAFPLEDQAGIWTDKVETAFGWNKVFGPTSGGAGSPSQTVFIRAVNNGSPGDIVGATVVAVAAADDTTVFGANILAIGTGKDNCRYVALELDVEPPLTDTNPAAGSAGIYINVFNKVLNGAFIQTGGVGGGLFENGIILGGLKSTGAGLALQAGNNADSLINTTVGTFTTAGALMGSGPTRGIKWVTNGGGIYFDGTHQRIVMPNTGGALIVRNPADTVSMVAFDTGGNVDLQAGGTVLFQAALSSGAATAGAATLPANPVGFLTVQIGGTNRKIPYYAS